MPFRYVSIIMELSLHSLCLYNDLAYTKSVVPFIHQVVRSLSCVLLQISIWLYYKMIYTINIFINFERITLARKLTFLSQISHNLSHVPRNHGFDAKQGLIGMLHLLYNNGNAFLYILYLQDYSIQEVLPDNCINHILTLI